MHWSSQGQLSCIDNQQDAFFGARQREMSNRDSSHEVMNNVTIFYLFIIYLMVWLGIFLVNILWRCTLRYS